MTCEGSILPDNNKLIKIFDGLVVCLIEKKWFDEFSSSLKITPISNAGLLREDKITLKEEVGVKKNFVVVSIEYYNKLVSVCKGGPRIIREYSGDDLVLFPKCLVKFSLLRNEKVNIDEKTAVIAVDSKQKKNQLLYKIMKIFNLKKGQIIKFFIGESMSRKNVVLSNTKEFLKDILDNNVEIEVVPPNRAGPESFYLYDYVNAFERRAHKHLNSNADFGNYFSTGKTKEKEEEKGDDGGDININDNDEDDVEDYDVEDDDDEEDMPVKIDEDDRFVVPNAGHTVRIGVTTAPEGMMSSSTSSPTFSSSSSMSHSLSSISFTDPFASLSLPDSSSDFSDIPDSDSF